MSKTRIAVLAALTVFVVPSIASAAPRLWGGNNLRDPDGPSSILMAVRNGQAKIKNVHLIMNCTDAADGTESRRAFDTRFDNYESLSLNRFRFEFTAHSGGRDALVDVWGVLRSNGTGVAKARVNATAVDDLGAVVERCRGRTRIGVRRGAA